MAKAQGKYVRGSDVEFVLGVVSRHGDAVRLEHYISCLELIGLCSMEQRQHAERRFAEFNGGKYGNN